MIKNKSVTYVLPLFCKYFASENINLQEALFVSFLENCYVFVKNKENIDEKFIIELNKPKDEKLIFENFIINLKNSIIFAEYFENNENIILIFHLPDTIKDTYYKFIEGNYSQINQEDKKVILEFCKSYTSLELSMKILKIFSKSETLRKELEEQLNMKIPKDIELSSKPNIELETFNINITDVQ